MITTQPLPLYWRRLIGMLWFGAGIAAGPVMALAGLHITIVGMTIIGFVLLAAFFAPVAPRRWDLASLAMLAVFCIWGRFSQSWSLFPAEADSLLIKCATVLMPVFLALPLVPVVRPGWRLALGDGLMVGMLVALILSVWDISHGFALDRWIHHLPPHAPPDINRYNRAFMGLAILSIPVGGLMARRGYASFGIFVPAAFFALSFRTDCQTATLGLGVAGVIAVAGRYSLIWTRRVVVGLFAIGVSMAVPMAWLLGHSNLVHADWLMLSARHRIEVWSWTAQRIPEHLWWGFGLGSSEKFFPLARDISVLLPPQEMMQHKHPHSMILQIWLEGGAFGAVCLLLLGYWMMARSRHLTHRGQYLALVCFGSIMAMMSITSFAFWHSWLICLLAMTVLIVRLADLSPDKIAVTRLMAQDLHDHDMISVDVMGHPPQAEQVNEQNA